MDTQEINTSSDENEEAFLEALKSPPTLGTGAVGLQVGPVSGSGAGAGIVVGIPVSIPLVRRTPPLTRQNKKSLG